MIISTYTEKPKTIIEHTFIIKLLMKVQIEGVYLNIRAIYNNPVANIILNREDETYSPLLFNIVLDILARTRRQEGDIKGIEIGKEVKLFLLANDVILCLKHLESSTKNLPDIINRFSK
jgi:hypothetical protein